MAAVPTRDRDAYDAFLHAEYQYDQYQANFDFLSLEAAIQSYRQAVEKDPGFALAFARLSIAESSLAWLGEDGENQAQLRKQAQADAEQALELQADLPAAHLALGYSAYWGHRDYDAALQAIAAALELRPNDAEALAAQGFVQRRQGHLDAAIESFGKAVALDPRNSTYAHSLADTYMPAGRYAEAESWCRRALALDPDSVTAKSMYVLAILLGSGDVPRALAQVQGDDPQLKLLRLQLLVLQRKWTEALALFRSVPLENFPSEETRSYTLATLHWGAGNRDRARELFSQGLPLDRANLEKFEGIYKARLWRRVAVGEIGTGNTAAGLDAIAKSEAILDRVDDALDVPYARVGDAAAYAMAERADLAVPLLARALAAPGIGGYYSPVMLWLDSLWDPIRDDPGFQALLAQYSRHRPPVIYASAEDG